MTEHVDGELKRGRSRPVVKPMPDLIPNTPENIMRAVLNMPPKREDEWRYLQEAD